MKHFGIISAVLVLFLFSSLFASEVTTLSASKVRAAEEKIIVPLELKNVQPMTGLELPLKYSKGVTLEEVTFDGTRSADFDFKWAQIDDENNSVVIGLIPMVYGEKPDMPTGEGKIAELVFRVTDPTIKAVELTPFSSSSPDHSLMYVTTNENGALQAVTLELSGFSVALSGSETNGSLPTRFALLQNYPNPFNPSTIIAYDLPKPANVRLEIFNVLGQKVKTLFDGYQEAGSQSVTWDGRDNFGASVASGIYFYRLNAGSFNAVKKMMMLK
jgi:hypothetical protein